MRGSPLMRTVFAGTLLVVVAGLAYMLAVGVLQR